jgi:serine protease Do
VIGSDEKTDIALIKITVKHPLPAFHSVSQRVSQVGDWVIANGNRLALNKQ